MGLNIGCPGQYLLLQAVKQLLLQRGNFVFCRQDRFLLLLQLQGNIALGID